MEVSKPISNMRFSPVLLAVLTASAAFSIARPASAQSLEAPEPGQGAIDTSSAATPGREQRAGVKPPAANQLSRRLVVPTVNAPERSPVEFLSQVPSGAAPGAESQPSDNNQINQPGAPPAGTQTPQQDTPNEGQIQVAPGSAGGQTQQPASGSGGTTRLTPFTGEPGAVPSDQPAGQTPGASPAEASPSPAAPSPATPSTPDSTQPGAATEAEPRVLVSEVVVSGAEGDLQNIVYQAIRTQAGRTATRSQLQEDINAIFATGYFSNVRAVPEDTPLGVRVTFEVQPNPTLSSVRLQGNSVQTIRYENSDIPLQQAVDRIFADQYGKILNLRDLQAGVQRLNKLYQDNGYVLAQVYGAPQVAPDGTVTLSVAEGVIENIQVQFLNKDGQTTNDKGEPVRGRTRPFIITREFESKPGDVFNRNRIQQDLQRVYGLGLFEDVKVALNPGQDPRTVDVTVQVVERRTGSLGAGVGVSSASGFFGTASFQEQNLGGNAQRLGAEVQVGQRELLFDVNFTDPWIAGDPNRTSYTVSAFGRRSVSLIFDGGPREVFLPNGDRPAVGRLGASVSFSRPLGDEWRASLGLQYQHVSILDSDNNVSPRDEFGNYLAFHRSGEDDITTLQFAAVQDRRNDPIQTTSGSLLRLSDEQTIPIGGILFNRVRASYSYFLPVQFLRFTPGCRKDNPRPNECPQTLAFNVQGGTILGDLPPYEAFSLGGTDSVRGYDAGDLGSGRSFLQATVEYRFPLFSIVGGALFFDVGTDLGTGRDVPGDPAGIRDKPGSGFGYGAGVRVQSPLGQIRIDYAINDQGDNRVHFGIGERF